MWVLHTTNVLFHDFICKPWLNNWQAVLQEIPVFKRTWINNVAFTKKNPDQLKSVKGCLSTKSQLIKGKIMITELKTLGRKMFWLCCNATVVNGSTWKLDGKLSMYTTFLDVLYCNYIYWKLEKNKKYIF